MAITVDTIQLKFNVKPSYEQQQIFLRWLRSLIIESLIIGVISFILGVVSTRIF